MSGIAAHYFEDHHPVVARRGWLQPIERLGGHHHRRVIADRGFRDPDIVVDRLGNTDEVDASLLRKPAQNCEAAVAANADQRVKSELAYSLDHLRRPVHQGAVRHGKGERIALIRRAQDGAA